jgi:hypothetical protein
MITFTLEHCRLNEFVEGNRCTPQAQIYERQGGDQTGPELLSVLYLLGRVLVNTLVGV